MTVPIPLPQANPNDSVATLVDWLAEPGTRVEAGQPVAAFETSKATYEVEAPAAGWLDARAGKGDSVTVGAVFAVLLPHPPAVAAPDRPATGGERKITVKARRLMEEHGIGEDRLPAGLLLVREADVQAVLAAAPPPATDPAATPAINLATDLDAVLERGDHRALMDLLGALRTRMKARHARHVPTGTLLNDRWDLARSFGFGPGASVYDECLILGNVTVGANCWIGPYTVLDGSGGGVSIGDWTSIGSGSHVYTHHTIDQALTGGVAKPFRAPTRIGRCCFIAPMAMIAPGSDIGDHSFVAAFSYVEGRFPPYSYIAGTPARVVGRVEIKDGRAVRVPD